MMTKQYNYCLDFIKGVACICVVLMHCEFPGILGVIVQTVSRFCVPLFFMVSGYFCYKPTVLNSIGGGNIRKIIHILKITVNACIFYTVFVLLLCFLGKELDWSISVRGLISWLIFNQPAWAGVAGQYWFLFALLYVYIVYGIISKMNKINIVYCLAALMLVAYVFLAQGCHLLGISVPNMIYRNWLVEGFAFFMLGHWIHVNQENLKYGNRYLLIIITITTLLCVLERLFVGRDFGVNIVTIPQVFCLFIYAVNNPNKHTGVLQIIGKRYSMYIYIIHPAIWHSVELVYEQINIETNIGALYAMPIIVIVLTFISSHIIYILNRKLKTV